MRPDGVVLAQVDPARVSAGSLGLLVVLLMGIATVLLVRNMNRHLRRLPHDFARPAAADAASDGGPAAAEVPRVPSDAASAVRSHPLVPPSER